MRAIQTLADAFTEDTARWCAHLLCKLGWCVGFVGIISSVAKNYDKRIEINRYPIIRFPISIYFNSLIIIYIRSHTLT